MLRFGPFIEGLLPSVHCIYRGGVPVAIVDLSDRRNHLQNKREKVETELAEAKTKLKGARDFDTRLTWQTLVGSKQAILNRIDAALLRIDAGSYGKCLRCKEPISSARLDARPEAEFC